MYVHGLGTAHPAHTYDKSQCWDAFQSSEWFDKLDRRSRAIAQTVLQRDNGIETRHLALDELSDCFQIDPDTLHARFARHAPALAIAAAERALSDARLSAAQIDGLVISTCTGYLCPGLSSYVIEGLGLRADVQALDLVGQGCGAALPNWRMADALLNSGACRHVLSVCKPTRHCPTPCVRPVKQTSRMYVHGLGTAHPTHTYDKSQCWDAFQSSEWFDKLDRRSRAIAQTVLQRDNGIETRHLALDKLSDCFQI
ncbi:MAG: hypothetical protein ABIW30_04975, partial [Arenimonas sp.]